jgi:regulator of nucleoside diphosphate kinase
MIIENKALKTHMVITERDFDKLIGLAESSRYRFSHSVLLLNLKRELESSTVVGAKNVSNQVVTMHSRVRFVDLATRESETYTLVYPQESDLDEGKLSVLAPLGTALLGKHVGHVVEFGVPGGKRRLKIEEILYQPEASGDYHL